MMIKICDGWIGPEIQKIVSSLRSGPPPSLLQEKSITKRENRKSNTEWGQTVCTLTEAGSKVYLFLEFPSSEWFCITCNKYKDHAVFLEWSHQVLVYVYVATTSSQWEWGAFGKQMRQLMYLFVRCISLQHNNNLLVTLFKKIGYKVLAMCYVVVTSPSVKLQYLSYVSTLFSTFWCLSDYPRGRSQQEWDWTVFEPQNWLILSTLMGSDSQKELCCVTSKMSTTFIIRKPYSQLHCKWYML